MVSLAAWVVCMMVVLQPGYGIPIMMSRIPVVISRNGRRGTRRQHNDFVRVNTCSLARMVLPTIKIGKCPATFDDYRHLYSRDSVSFLDSYYKKHCDIVYIREPNFGDRYITPLIGLTFMLMALLLFTSCITGVVVKIYATATKFLTSVGN